MRETNLLSGVFHSIENIPVVFFVNRDTFEFNFGTDSIYPHEDDNGSAYLKPIDGFIYGQTHQGNNVAIYTGTKGLVVDGHQRIFSSLYAVSSSCTKPQNISTFTGIRFIGETLNSVFPTKYLRYCYKDNEFVFEKKDNQIVHQIKTSKYDMEWAIKAPDPKETGLDGLPNDNPNVMLDIFFDSPQPLSTLSLHYNKLKELLSFMTFRYNVGFHSVELVERDTTNNILSKVADVYINNEIELTTKEYHYNISFHDLGKALPKLIEILYDTEDKKPSYSLGFLPDSDRELYQISSTRIREICSALECELGFVSSINEPSNELLEKLIEKVRNEIKTFRKENEGLSNDTYSMIFSSVNKWSFPLAEKLIALYHTYEPEMQILNHYQYQVSDAELRLFVKYRNDVTHGKHRVLEPKVRITAHILSGLVYCCILKRIGVGREKIQELCQEKKITT